MNRHSSDHLQGAAHYAHTTLSIVCVTYHFIVPPCFLAPLFNVATVSGTPAAQGPLSAYRDYHRNTELLISPGWPPKDDEAVGSGPHHWLPYFCTSELARVETRSLTEQPTIPSCLAACTCVSSLRFIDITDGARFGSTGPLGTDWQGPLRLD